MKHDLAVHSLRGLHCTWLVPHTKASSDGVDNSDLGEWIYLKRVVVPWKAWPNRPPTFLSWFGPWTLHHALRWDGRLVESQEGLETKVGPRADLARAGCKDYPVFFVISLVPRARRYSTQPQLT
ncbi:hypothetical protein M9H77_16587 [Catharanthus roseus]|uniref:Uncharacterized protein n=1 Tax=Catharanthus roseus TaxID=4058 RepID=A0ACC0B267_CATRO|nr:hypothetical protein M9H77_16587 [Catharanthus roseus]